MTGFRFLLLAVAGWLLGRLLRALDRRMRQDTRQRDTPAYTPMARCPRCGAHAPVSSMSALCDRCRPDG